MKRLYCIILVFLVLLVPTGCRREEPLPYIMPVTLERNGISITVDPRVELMSIVQYLSTQSEFITIANFSYRDRVDAHYAAFSIIRRCKCEEMRRTGFGFSSPANFALSLNESMRWDDDAELSRHVLAGAGGKEKLRKFAEVLRDFFRDSDFHLFYAANEDFYRDNVYRVAALLEDGDYVAELQDYFGMEYESFTVLPVPLYGGGGGFGSHVERGGNIEAYCILLAFDDAEMQDDVPVYGDKATFRLILRHEFSHSFVNRVTDLFHDEVMQYEYLLEPIRREMEELQYGSWVSCLNEHIVRAVTVRLAYADSPQEGSRALRRELDSGFIYRGAHRRPERIRAQQGPIPGFHQLLSRSFGSAGNCKTIDEEIASRKESFRSFYLSAAAGILGKFGATGRFLREPPFCPPCPEKSGAH